MAGTKEGGAKARDANLAKDPQFYNKIGRKGGLKGGGKNGFHKLTPEQLHEVSRKGGLERGYQKRKLT
jgi:general stress protein YciG